MFMRRDMGDSGLSSSLLLALNRIGRDCQLEFLRNSALLDCQPQARSFCPNESAGVERDLHFAFFAGLKNVRGRPTTVRTSRLTQPKDAKRLCGSVEY
jgi:hypothetical protein